MGIREHLLNEERLDRRDREYLFNIINKGPKSNKITYILKSFDREYSDDEREVEIRKIGGMPVFEYNSDHFELTNTLVDICDLLGIEFKVDTEGHTNTTYFKITKGM